MLDNSYVTGLIGVNIFYRSSYQQPKIPEIRRDYAEHLYYGCKQDNVLQVPETKKDTVNKMSLKNKVFPFKWRKTFVLLCISVDLVLVMGHHNEVRASLIRQKQLNTMWVLFKV